MRSLGSLAAHKLMRTGNDVTVLARGAGRRFSIEDGLVIDALDPGDCYDLIAAFMTMLR